MKKAFTMIELIFVIVVIGILAAVIMPRSGSNKLQEAAIQVLSHIRYTQHLAMVDDKFNENNATWYESLWRIRFYQNTGTWYYTVFNDKDQNGNCDTAAGKEEVAIDPLSKINMNISNNNNNMDLTTKFGITNIASTCDSGFLDTFFDNLGRPYFHSVSAGANPPYSNLLMQDCNITFTGAEGSVIIKIHPETGYACILNGNVCQN